MTAMPPILTLENVTKIYPGVVALQDVSLSIDPGEVRVLLGKNGAGKSTAVKILSGAIQPDQGHISIDGQLVHFHTPHDAFAAGLCTVYQELSLIPGLTVAENITMGRWPLKRWLGIEVIDRDAIRRIAQDALDQLEVHIDLNEKVSRLTIAHQQLVEIAKAISFNPRILMLDEPTSALSSGEVDVLHTVVRRLAAQGRAIIYVTHRLQEVPRIAHSVTVLRDSRHVGTIPVTDATPQRIATMMFGEGFRRTERGAATAPGEVKLSVRNLIRGEVLCDISFDLCAGEVLGIAGLMGAGRTELLRAIFGLDPVDSGQILVDGQIVDKPMPGKMKMLGVGLTPEDRKRQGLVLPFSVQDNLTLASLHRVSQNGVLQPVLERALASDRVEGIDIKTPGLDTKTRTLSGGNQQKVVVGNWLNTLPSVLMMDEPSRGIDIQAKEQIFTLVRELARQGLAVLFVSSEIEEVLDVADRILIMSQGRITGEVKPEAVNIERLLELVMEEAS